MIPDKVRVTSLARQHNGTLWAGSPDDGLYSVKDGVVAHYSSTNGLLSDKAYSLYADAGDSLWAGTSAGINRFMGTGFASLTQASGLEAQLVSGMAEDLRGNFWIHSSHGIYRARRGELDDFFLGKRSQINTIRYGLEDGLVTATSTTESQSHICRDTKGRMWFATLKGAAMVDPAAMPENTSAPSVSIEEILADGKPWANVAGPIRFPAGARQIEIHYTATCLTAPEKVYFRCRVEGLRPGWTDLGNRRVVTFEQAPHGDYRFQVIARNNDGVWNETGASFAFAVLPFF